MHPKVLEELLSSSQKLMLIELTKTVEDLCPVNPENASYYFELSKYYNLNTLKRKSLECLKNNLTTEQSREVLSEFGQHPEIRKIFLKFLAKVDKTDNKDLINKLLHLIYPKEIPKEELDSLHSETIIYLLKNCPEKIVSLNLSIYHHEEIREIAQYLPENLQELNLSNLTLESETIDHIARRCPYLTKLIMENASKPKTSDIDEWASLLRLRNLKVLQVDHCEDIVPYLEDIIYNNAKHLEVLHIGELHPSQENASPIALELRINGYKD